MFFNVRTTFAKFENDLTRLRIRAGMAIARSGKLRSQHPKLTKKQQPELRQMHRTGDYAIRDLAEVFLVLRLTVYRTLARQPITFGQLFHSPTRLVRLRPRQASVIT